MLAGLQAGFHEGVGRVQPAHGLHHDLNFPVLFNHLKIVDNLIRHRTVREIPQIQNILQFHILPCLPGDHIPVLIQYLRHAGTDGPISHYRYFYHVHTLPVVD